MVLHKSLRASGFRAEEARSGEEALAAIRQRHFDLVLLDLEMAGLDGVEACREISNFAPQTGIIVMSVRDEVNDVVEALAAGADDYLAKPFGFRELVARLRAVDRRIQRPRASLPATLTAGEVNLDDNQPISQGASQLVFQKRSC